MRFPLPTTCPPADAEFPWTGTVTDDARRFLDEHGFVRFSGFASRPEVGALLDALSGVEDRWRSENRTTVNGIPVKWGTGLGGQRFVQRFAFASQHSARLTSFFREPRWEVVRQLCGPDFRIGLDEKDGLVVNHYLNTDDSHYTKLGWHVDGLRDLFYGRPLDPMWNVGLHLDDCAAHQGGLRLLPGTHRQGRLGMLLGKAHFLAHDDDPREVMVATKAGDLTIHDGRLWHRVARALVEGEASRRRVMYVPFIEGPVNRKHANSPTPLYHHLSGMVR